MMNLTAEQFSYFERFFQYGDLTKANLIFVGFEEGLGFDRLENAVENRLSKPSKHPEVLGYINEPKGTDDVFFIKEFSENSWLDNNHRFTTREEYLHSKIPNVMLFQGHFKLLFDSKLEDLKLKDFDTKRKHYVQREIHNPGSDTAMFELCPLPKLNLNEFDYKIDSMFSNKKEYYKYCLKKNNPRIKMINRLYDEYPMTISVIYAGKNKGDFKAEKTYYDMGFNFDYVSDTGVIPTSYKGSLTPNKKPKVFKIGTRKRKDGKTQFAVLTPFFGVGNLSYLDLSIIISHFLDITK